MRFVDSYQFLPAKLESLAALLESSQCREVRKAFPDDAQFNHMRQKGVFPYSYLTNVEKFNEVNLPAKECFYDELRDEPISDEEYSRACNVWATFGCQTLGDYPDIDLTADVLHPAHCFTAPAAPPDCKSVGLGKYPGETCSQYYECTKRLWSFNVKSKVCPDGQIFDISTKNCLDGSCNETEPPASTQRTNEETTVIVTSTKVNDTGTTSTSKEPTYSSVFIEDDTGVTIPLTMPAEATTAAPSTAATPPDCKSVGPGKYPSETCNQYYECLKIMWWYNIKSQDCPDGQIFDLIKETCLDGSCSTTEVLATTQPIKEETTVIITSTNVIDCDGTITSKAGTYSSASTEDNKSVTITGTPTTPAKTTTAALPTPGMKSASLKRVLIGELQL
nr:unnamed protein product [Callosobruchus analis]